MNLTEPGASWIHIAAMNLIAEHEAGAKVNGHRLNAAYALMADFRAKQGGVYEKPAEPSRARISTEEPT